MHNVIFAVEGALRVLLVGLLFGAGLPAVFALGVRALAYGEGGGTEINSQAPHLLGKVLAYLAFAVVVGGVLLGLTVIVASGLGKELTFDGGVPTFVDE
ncbi:MAG: hypothetical protein K0R30_634 [Ornithinibacter sp.]|jgi:hypothetical protein|nr:hypothetical protein [Ornithinibacter sp.]